MELIVWRPEKYNLEIPDLDQQHENIFDAIFSTYAAIRHDDSKKYAEKELTILIQAIRNHFYAEELMMLTYHYPDVDAHIGRHMVFNNILTSIVNAFTNNDISLVTENLIYLDHWLIEHIQTADGHFKAYLVDNNISID